MVGSRIRPSNGRFWKHLLDLFIGQSDRMIQWSDLIGSTISDHPTVGSNLVGSARSCSKSYLEDEVHEYLDVDQNAYNMKMKLLYGRASQKVEPTKIRREKDVRTFISEVRQALVRPLLYVEMTLISPQLSKGEHENIAYTSRHGFKSEDENDVFGDTGCDDIADDDGVTFGNTAQEEIKADLHGMVENVCLTVSGVLMRSHVIYCLCTVTNYNP
ncbi:hypothetical protein FNV43_RR04627 [Rhamnella rubrinervis]|uniref:Uncharacterized protein n=1 Tax=Rhamnella rubrinervis TaxID=2594499 RepID=A0A8K0HKM8_9ROSA|nr:hypothetical protein FNV43_RR04627 [Rhamnella rubrinervis]